MTDQHGPPNRKLASVDPPDDPPRPTGIRPSGSVGERWSRDRPPGPDVPTRTRVGALWAGMIAVAAILVVLLAFVMQNETAVVVYFFVWEVTLSVGVALLFAAIAGLLLGAIPGTLRITQLRRAAHRRH